MTDTIPPVAFMFDENGVSTVTLPPKDPARINLDVNGLDITLWVCTITPEVAREWLARNTHNRNMRKVAHERYMRDMLDGEWSFTGAPITFDYNGVLIDGQNRLTAIAESGVSVPAVVIFGLEPAAQEDTDTGIPRKFVDVLTLRGENNASHLAALVRKVAEWDKGARGKGMRAFSTSELLATLDRHPELRAYTAPGYRISKHVFSLAPSTACLAKWVLDGLDAADSEFFFERLIDGQGLVEGDPIYVLRKTLKDLNKGQRGTASQSYALALLFKSWNAYREGRRVGLLRYKPGGAKPEAFPEPV